MNTELQDAQELDAAYARAIYFAKRVDDHAAVRAVVSLRRALHERFADLVYE